MARFTRITRTIGRIAFGVLAATAVAVAPQLSQSAAAATSGPAWGVYVGPGATGVSGAQAFASTTGVKLGTVLDFLPTDTWAHLNTSQWVFDAHRNSPYKLEISIPMLPSSGGATLAACANGEYNPTWSKIAGFIQARGMAATTTVRPGWEANGDWFSWSAAGKTTEYVGCYRQLVTTMRAAAPSLTFNWSVASGYTKLAGELIYPGDDVVDVVSVDVYDQSWVRYPAAGQTVTQAQAAATKDALAGNHGLQFWSAFAKAHAKPMALSEWGLTWRSDLRGGGDNVAFAEMILTFAKDPANNVAFATYFNNPDSGSLKHNLTTATTVFPAASQVVLSGMSAA